MIGERYGQMIYMKNVAHDPNFPKKKIRVEISTLVEYSTGIMIFFKNPDFLTQTSFLQGFSISIFMVQNDLKNVLTWPKPHFC